MLHKIINTAQKQLDEYATGLACQLTHIKEYFPTANFDNIDSYVWLEKPNLLVIESLNSIICAYEANELWLIFAVLKSGEHADTYAQNYQKLIKAFESNDLNLLAFGNPHFVMDIFADSSNEYKIANWCTDLRKTEHIMFEIDYVSKEIIATTRIKPMYPVDIYSHDYQMKYASELHPTQLSFYTQAFMELGTGYHWNSDGNLCYHGVKYKPEIQQIKDIELGEIYYLPKYFDSNNLVQYPDNITPEWQQARATFIQALKDIVADFDNMSATGQKELLDGSTLEDIREFIDKCENGVKAKKIKP